MNMGLDGGSATMLSRVQSIGNLISYWATRMSGGTQPRRAFTPSEHLLISEIARVANCHADVLRDI